MVTQMVNTVKDVFADYAVKNEATAKSADATLTTVKNFITAVSVCELILVKLPEATSDTRGSLITSHLSKADASSAEVPANLRTFLNAELKKRTKRKKPMAR